MDNSTKGFCRLCRDITVNKNITAVEGVTRDVLNILLPKLDLDRTELQAICSICSTKLFQAYNFKSTIIDNEDSILTYTINKEVTPFDLKDLYLKHKGNDQQISNYNICRLCFNPVRERFMQLEDISDLDIVHRYIPEVNFNATKNSVICQQCFNSLEVHSGFLKDCLNSEEKTEEKTINACKNEFSNAVAIEVDKIEIKSENEDQDSSQCLTDTDHGMVKKEEIGGDSENAPITEHLSQEAGQIYNCQQGSHEIKHENNLTNHLLTHQGTLKISMFKCGKCGFQTKNKHGFIAHQLEHRNPSSKGEIYKCGTCHFQTKYAHNLAIHQLRHLEQHEYPSKVQMYKCGMCDYQSDNKCNLVIHQLLHRDSSKGKMYKCLKCNFQTKCKYILIKHHQVQHGDRSKRQMYECDQCDFQARYIYGLIKHQIQHKDPSEEETHKCHKCKFQTKLAYSHKQHNVKKQKVQMYKCDQCDFQAKHGDDILKHQLFHI